MPRSKCERGRESAIAEVPAASVHPNALATIHHPLLRMCELKMSICQPPTMSPPRVMIARREYGIFNLATFEMSIMRNGTPSPTMHEQIQ